ncbi:ATP-binding protein [Peterkaempfera sp. SMS 1(5)a]|uniref:AAA family ATPase n=1 Tax=Peterkaempfera podocarpi TaxID=3232308 RepID=UPI00366C8849
MDLAQLRKPPEIFDREAEWAELAAFVCNDRPGATLGVVAGPPRQGKSALLEALTAECGGFYFAAQEGAESESLRRLADDLARHTGSTEPPRLTRWGEALDALFALGERQPLPVVLDGFPHLVRQCPALPSVLLNAYGRPHQPRERSRTRLLLCGSARSVMGRVFGSTSPLHGVAGLSLTVHPLDFRQAARLWGVTDPGLAVELHAVLGGSAAYRHDYVCDDTPSAPDDLDAWICRTVLNPRMPLFHEATHLLEEEPGLPDRAVCHSTLAAVASGAATRGEIAERLGLRLEDVTHALAQLQDCGLLTCEPNAFHPRRERLRITEPLLAFEHAVLRPHRSQLERQPPAEVWPQLRPVFDAAVVGPHFARLCRDWALGYASTSTFPGIATSALPGAVADLAVDVAVRGEAGGRPAALLSVGTARWAEPLDLPDLEGLHRVLEILTARGEDTSRTLPACYGAAGFSPGLRTAASRGEVLLVDLDRLYHGS